MKTHKNPALRAGNIVPANSKPTKHTKHTPSSAYVPKPFQASRPVTRPVIPKKAPVKELQAGKKWIVVGEFLGLNKMYYCIFITTF